MQILDKNTFLKMKTQIKACKIEFNQKNVVNK